MIRQTRSTRRSRSVLGSRFAATLAVGFMGCDGFARVDETIDEVAAVIDSTTAALEQADTTLAGVGVSLSETAGVVDEAAALAATVSDAAVMLADQAGCFLGQNPFEGVEQPLRDASESLERLAGRLDAVSVAPADNATDVTTLATRLGAVAQSLGASRDRIASVASSRSSRG